MFSSATQATFTLPHQPEYDHTQSAPMYWLMLVPALAILLVAGILSEDADVLLPMLAMAGLLVVIAFSFRSLRVVDEGTRLVARFGPIPIFSKRMVYADIVAAEPDRTSLVDGWGIHWVPGRGWTYNLWGFDCVRFTFAGGKTIRIGTDDPHGLARFLQQRIAQH
jgi:hypothetical protein